MLIVRTCRTMFLMHYRPLLNVFWRLQCLQHTSCIHMAVISPRSDAQKRMPMHKTLVSAAEVCNNCGYLILYITFGNIVQVLPTAPEYVLVVAAQAACIA
jgi:hypothetical protein